MQNIPRGAGPAPPASLAGRVALVTGASGALGQAVVRDFTERGAAVLGVDLAGPDCLHVDIGTEEGNERAVAEALGRFGRLDILVLNAGLQHMSPIPEFSLERWQTLIDVMLTGPFLTIRAAWPALIARPGSRILVTASTSSFVADPYKAAYVTAKHGVLGLVKVAALEGAEHGLTANAVAPSWMRTPLAEKQIGDRMRLLDQTREEVITAMVDTQAAKRFVETSEVAATLAFLAGPEASAITGSCLPVDLGALA
jgi:3-hydroxybutyrate dehydrogenase